ncbi:MAG: VOC family protein [Chloroflexota bacterium]
MSIFENINVVYVYVRDWERAKQFYADVLQWPVAYQDDTIGWVEYGAEGQTHFAISRWDDPQSLPPQGLGATITFTVEDAEQATRLLRQKGVVCDEPINIPGVVLYGTFYDPEGNRFQMASAPK